MAVLRFAVFGGSGVAIFSAGVTELYYRSADRSGFGEREVRQGTYATFELFEHDI